MKFALSTESYPFTEAGAIAARAKEWGYDGVELVDRLDFAGEQAPTDAVAAVATCIGPTGDAATDRRYADIVAKSILWAAAMACDSVVVLDVGPKRGLLAWNSEKATARWLAELADIAADKGVKLLVENGFRTRRRTRDLWRLVDSLNHPAVGLCWNVLSAAMAGGGGGG